MSPKTNYQLDRKRGRITSIQHVVYQPAVNALAHENHPATKPNPSNNLQSRKKEPTHIASREKFLRHVQPRSSPHAGWQQVVRVVLSPLPSHSPYLRHYGLQNYVLDIDLRYLPRTSLRLLFLLSLPLIRFLLLEFCVLDVFLVRLRVAFCAPLRVISRRSLVTVDSLADLQRRRLGHDSTTARGVMESGRGGGGLRGATLWRKH